MSEATTLARVIVRQIIESGITDVVHLTGITQLSSFNCLLSRL
jgi:hypothetical protein